MAKRRARGEGSLFQWTRRGKTVWAAELTVGFDQHGKRVKRRATGETQAEVREKIEKLRDQVRAGVDLVDGAGRQKLGKYLEEWLKAKIDAELLEPSTAATYGDLIRLHIKPSLLATRKLEAVRPADIKRWQAELRRREVGARTRKQAHSMLQTALGNAVRENALLYNPADRVERPRVAKREPIVLDREHRAALRKAAAASPFEAAFLLAMLHGLRIGEVLGLTWGKVDLRERKVTISQQLREDRRTGKRELVPPKTAASKRTVPLSGLAVASLERLLAQVGARPLPTRLLFCDANGGPLRRSNFHRRVWVPTRDKAKLPKGTRFHDLRHTAASTLLAGGMDSTTVARILGHASSNVTHAVYAHALPSRMSEAAELIDAIYAA